MKDEKVYLLHIIECIDAIWQDYYAGLSNPKELFLTQDKSQQATLHRLQTIGQSIKNISPDTLERINKTIDWVAITDFRNILVHEYLGVDLEIVWNVVEKELPPLKIVIKQFLEKNNV